MLFTFQYVSIISSFLVLLSCYPQDLHSNMFLLFLSIHPQCHPSKFIYIPICFYYFENTENIAREAEAIYIPICFYYFKRLGRVFKRAVQFTFQYVSIISCFAFNSHANFNPFTFQYVSIISRPM